MRIYRWRKALHVMTLESVVLTVPPGPSILSRAAAATSGAAIVFPVNAV